MRTSGLGISILLIAAGAILAWAVTVDTDGVNLNTVGVILFVVGIVGLIATLALTAAGTPTAGTSETRTIIERD